MKTRHLFFSLCMFFKEAFVSLCAFVSSSLWLYLSVCSVINVGLLAKAFLSTLALSALVVCLISPQVNVSPGTKKLFAATAFGAVSLFFLARHFKRRKGKKKAQSPWEQEEFDFLLAASPDKGDCFSCPALPQKSHVLAAILDYVLSRHGFLLHLRTGLVLVIFVFLQTHT